MDEDDATTIIHEVSKHGTLYFLANAFIGAMNKIGDALIRNGDGLAAQIEANQQEIRQTMSALSDAVAAVAADQKEISADVTAVLAILQQPNPDVAAAVSALQAVKVDQDASAKALEAVIPPAPPVV